MKHLEKETERFLEEIAKVKSPPIYKLSILEARKVLDDLQSKPAAKLPVQEEEIHAGSVSIRLVRPQNQKEKLPIVMYFHGGGWILGNQHTHDRLVREIACGAEVAVAFVNYTPSPEAKYPTPIEEAYTATRYLAEHGKNFHLDPSRLAVMGDSVGGNMAAVVTLLAKERGGPKIDFQVLFYPVTDANFDTPSYREFGNGPWLTKPAMEWFWNAYEPNLANRKKHTACPLQASLDQLQHLPPALIITDENDVLRDEGEAYAHKLMQAGVTVTAVRYLGTIHDFALLNPLAQTPAARNAISLAIHSLQKAFNPHKRD